MIKNVLINSFIVIDISVFFFCTTFQLINYYISVVVFYCNFELLDFIITGFWNIEDNSLSFILDNLPTILIHNPLQVGAINIYGSILSITLFCQIYNFAFTFRFSSSRFIVQCCR